YYGKKGCITATMDYSLVSEKHPEVTIKTMLDEIAACTAALKKQLEKEGYHVSGMAIGGTSAGGHLSMLYAYSRGKDSAIPIAFVFEKVGPVSVSSDFWDEKTAAALIGYGAGIKVDAGKLDDPEIVAAADSLSPVHFVGPDSPPTIFAYGGKDTLVKPVHRNALAKALGEHHVPNRCVDFPNSNHALWDDAESTEVFRQAVLEYCVRYMKADSPQTEEKFEKR
ncbi:MAG: alpha/beta hydrolase, partial [Lentisphaeria bacterium]|nr:alpha/beta hydrolase [Lentisphaeria bacterium]